MDTHLNLPNTEGLTFEKVWALFQESRLQHLETEKLLKESSLETKKLLRESSLETEKLLKESSRETEKLLKENSLETDRRFKETEKLLKERSLETDRRFQETEKFLKDKSHETDKHFRETDKKIKELTGLFTTQWGKLMESLIEPSCLKLFHERGLDISRSVTNIKIKKGGEDIAEFDIMLVNGTEVVVIEVKTTLKKEDIDDLLEKMGKIREYFPEMANKKFYGAVAAIKYDNNTTRYAYRQGLFVLKNSGEGIIKIANPINFCPFPY